MVTITQWISVTMVVVTMVTMVTTVTCGYIVSLAVSVWLLLSGSVLADVGTFTEDCSAE